MRLAGVDGKLRLRLYALYLLERDREITCVLQELAIFVVATLLLMGMFNLLEKRSLFPAQLSKLIFSLSVASVLVVVYFAFFTFHYGEAYPAFPLVNTLTLIFPGFLIVWLSFVTNIILLIFRKSMKHMNALNLVAGVGVLCEIAWLILWAQV